MRESGGTIVICGRYSLTYTTHLPNNDKPITITSVYDGVDYGEKSSARLGLKYSLYLYGDYIFENIKLNVEGDNLLFVCNWNNVTIGDGVETTLQSGIKQYPLFLVGANVAIGGAPYAEIYLNRECNITVNGGTWLYIRAGNRRGNAAFPLGGVDKDGKLTVTVNGGVYTNTGGNNLTAATGMSNNYGECNLIINGGDFRGPVYGVSRVGGNTSPEKAEMTGVVNLVINGGTFAGKIIAVQDNTIKVTGQVNVTVAAEYESKLSGNYTNKTVK